MKKFLWRFIHTLKVFVLFVGLTVLFYSGMVWLNDEYKDYNRYDEPDGAAVKVSNHSEIENTGWFERLKLFYLNGE
ncbi:MAG: YqzK family protein [Bacillus sp. (in: firmicutes)]